MPEVHSVHYQVRQALALQLRQINLRPWDGTPEKPNAVLVAQGSAPSFDRPPFVIIWTAGQDKTIEHHEGAQFTAAANPAEDTRPTVRVMATFSAEVHMQMDDDSVTQLGGRSLEDKFDQATTAGEIKVLEDPTLGGLCEMVHVAQVDELLVEGIRRVGYVLTIVAVFRHAYGRPDVLRGPT